MDNTTKYAAAWSLFLLVLFIVLWPIVDRERRQRQRALIAAQQQIAASDAIVQSLTAELEDARAALAQKPTETIVTITAPCHTPPPRVVPVFPRDSQLTGRGGD